MSELDRQQVREALARAVYQDVITDGFDIYINTEDDRTEAFAPAYDAQQTLDVLMWLTAQPQFLCVSHNSIDILNGTGGATCYEYNARSTVDFSRAVVLAADDVIRRKIGRA